MESRREQSEPRWHPRVIRHLGSCARSRAVLITAALVPVIASAQGGAPPSAASSAGGQHLDLGFGIDYGLLGLGVEVNKLIFGHLGVRAGYSTSSFSINHTISNLNLAATLKLQGAPLLVDVYPFSRGPFHLSGGVLLTTPQLTGTAQPQSGGTFKLNGTQYTAAQVGTLHGSVKWPSGAPYFGLGFGTPARKSLFAATFNFGAVVSKANVGLTSTGGTGGGNFQSDLQAQQASMQSSVHKLPVFPVFSGGFLFRI